MTWATELQKLRRYLRDPDGNIWSEGLLRDLWNEAQSDLQNRTTILEDVASISIPPRYQISYVHDWEQQFVPDGWTAYRCFRNQGDYFAFTSRFEAQVAAGIGTDGTDEGAAVTHPWEAWVHTSVGHEIPLPLPRNFHATKWLSYDRDPIAITTRRRVQETGSSWVTHQGTAQAYYHTDDVSNQIVLWPRPTTADWRDGAEDPGMLTHIEDDTNAVDTGTITRRTGTLLSGDEGMAVDAIELDDNMLLAYDIAPTDMTSLSSEPDWPEYMRRYVRYGVLQRAYGTNTDGHIPTLAAYWADRYKLGVEALKQFRRKRTVRTRRLGSTVRTRRDMRPRLPDTFPAI